MFFLNTGATDTTDTSRYLITWSQTKPGPRNTPPSRFLTLDELCHGVIRTSLLAQVVDDTADTGQFAQHGT